MQLKGAIHHPFHLHIRQRGNGGLNLLGVLAANGIDTDLPHGFSSRLVDEVDPAEAAAHLGNGLSDTGQGSGPVGQT
jgi:hypothetical protein